MKDAPIPSGVLGGEPAPAILAGPYAVRIARLPPLLQLPPHGHLHATLNVVLEGRYGEAVERGGVCLAAKDCNVPYEDSIVRQRGQTV